MTIGEAIAALVRKEAETHEDWDSLHSLQVIYRDGEDGIKVTTYAAIDPSFDPGFYPYIIEGITRETAAKDGPPYALLLTIEAFGARAPKDDAPAEEKAQFERDRVNRTIHQRPDAVEAVWAWAADVYGNMWAATKGRGSDVVEEYAYEPGSPEAGGRMAKAMLDALLIYGSEYAS